MNRFLAPRIAALPASLPFTGPETLERRQGFPFRARLGANESSFGPSPRALAAMRAALDGVWMYPDPESHDLRAAIAARHGCAMANVAVGGGIDGLLGVLCRLTVEPGTPVVTSLGGYPTFAHHVAGCGGRLVEVPYHGLHEDIGALVGAARREGARLVYLANPDNPMGSHHRGAAIEAMVAELPGTALLVLDEAYADLAPPEALARIDPAHPQVIRLRSFSKGHGLAGARVGYALGEAGLIAAFDRLRDHFGMGRVALAGALAALDDGEWLASVRARMAAARRRLGQIAAENGLEALPSATNFVTVDCGRDGAFARAVLAGCLARGLFIRMPGVAPLDRCIRISLGPDAALDVVAEVLPAALAAAR